MGGTFPERAPPRDMAVPETEAALLPLPQLICVSADSALPPSGAPDTLVGLAGDLARFPQASCTRGQLGAKRAPHNRAP